MYRLAFFIGILGLTHLSAAPQTKKNPWDKVDNMSYQVRNLDEEIRELKERLGTQEELFDTLQSDIAKSTRTHSEMVKGSGIHHEERLRHMQDELIRIQQYTLGLEEFVGKVESRLHTIEEAFQRQSQNMSTLEQSLRQLISHVRGQDEATVIMATTDRMYRVKEGDNLEKIAKKNNSTVRAIKELNNLNSDRIFVGQRLKLPD